MKARNKVTYEYKQINTRDLLVDELYQRDINPRRLMRMVKNYDPCLVNAVKVSFRDGKYWVYDGRHTMAMLKAVTAKGNDTMVDCKVFSGLTRLDEMELFVEQNGESAIVGTNDKMRALYNFGDKDICGMVSGANSAGVVVDFTKNSGINKCVAVRTLLKAYLMLPREQYIDMLKVLRKAWDGASESFSREIILGMAMFYKTYNGRFTSANLVKSLRKVLPVHVVREGKAYASNGTAGSTYARVILRFYNSGRSVNRLPDEI